MIKKYSLSLLQKTIQFALSLDSAMPEKLASLDGKVVEVVIEPLDIHFFLQFKDKNLFLSESYESSADTVIHSSPLGLIRLSFLPASKARSLFNDKIRISGDIELGHQVKNIFDELDIDWESHIAQFTGDVVAYQLGTIFRQGNAFKNRLKNSLTGNLTDYLQEEKRLTPSRAEVEDFYSDVAALRHSIERLEARINLIQAHNEID